MARALVFFSGLALAWLIGVDCSGVPLGEITGNMIARNSAAILVAWVTCRAAFDTK